MKKIKKIMALALAASCLLSLFGGCGKKADNGYDAKNDVWTYTIWSYDSHMKTTMERLVAEYNAGEGKEKGIKIDYVVQTAGEALKMAIESDTAPDLYSNVLAEDVEMGRIIAIEDMPGGAEWLKQYDGQLVEGIHQIEGKTYKVPYYVTTFGMVYNKDMFKKYGIVDENGEPTPPKTYDELREYAKKMTNPANQEYGIMLPLKNMWFASSDIEYPMMTQRGYMSYNPETGEIDYTGYKPIVDMYMGIKKDGSYYPDPEGIDNDPGRAQFSEGNVGMKLSASYDVGVYNEQFPAKCDWGVAPFPTETGEKYYSAMTSNGYLCINAKSAETKDKERLFEVYKWLHGPEVLKALYKEGMAIPYDMDIVKDIELGDDAPKGWKEFCELAKISTPVWIGPGTVMTGQKNFSQVFMEDIWTENVTVEDALADMTKRSQDGLKLWLEENPDKKLEDYIQKDVLKKVEE